MPSSQLLRDYTKRLVRTWLRLSDPAPADFAALVEINAPYRAAMQELRDATIGGVRADWTRAGDEFAQYLARVVRNNPTKTIHDILQRQDVQEAMHRAFGEAAASVQARMDRLSIASSNVGRRAATAELRAVGVDVPDIPVHRAVAEYAAQINGDLERNAAGVPAESQVRVVAEFNSVEAPASYHEIESGVENVLVAQAEERAAAVLEAISDEVADQGLRAGAGASSLANRAFNVSKTEMYAEVNRDQAVSVTIEKVWVSQLDETTCETCAALHGTVISVESEFDSSQSFASGEPPEVYGDLDEPPRHPNCNCMVVAFVTTESAEGGTTVEEQAPEEGSGEGVELARPRERLTPAAMRRHGREHAERSRGMAPRTFRTDKVSITSRTTAHMAASDVRGLSEARYQQAVNSLRASVRKEKRASVSN